MSKSKNLAQISAKIDVDANGNVNINSAVSPSSVTGKKDAVDEDGNPILQTMQASSPEVMANVVAELQFLRKRVTSLEEEITYLKAA